jgi:PAS domain S-box-containing protein
MPKIAGGQMTMPYVTQSTARLMSGASDVRNTVASKSHLLEAMLSSIPDCVYAFDRKRRFAYANSATLALFGLSADELLGKSFADLGYSPDFADRLNGHIDRVIAEGITIEDEAFFYCPTGREGYFALRWGPVRAVDGSIELVIGVSRDVSERHFFEDHLGRSEARLRAAAELIGLGIYSWDPVTNALEWDERLRGMWGLPAEAPVDVEVFESGIHPDDLPRVKRAISACTDPAREGRYNVEYRVLGRDDGLVRNIATCGRTSFADGRAVGFIGAAIDVTHQRRAEAASRASESQFRRFAEHSSNLIWIGDPAAGTIVYRNSAYEKIWGVSCQDAPTRIAEWLKDVHPDDQHQVQEAFAKVNRGEVAKFEYRIVRRTDGKIRRLRDTSFPIPDERGAVSRIGGITEDLTQEDVRQVYVVCSNFAEARRLTRLVRALGYRTRTFESGSALLDIASVLSPGCVLVDLRRDKEDGLMIVRELRARSIPLPTILLDASDADVTVAVTAMKAGAVDYLTVKDELAFRNHLANSMAECHPCTRPITPDGSAGAKLARLTPREREVLVGLVEGGTNKSIGLKLGISARTVEMYRAQVMSRLNAKTLTQLIKIALLGGFHSE